MKFVIQNLNSITLIIGDRQKHVFSSIKVAEIIIKNGKSKKYGKLKSLKHEGKYIEIFTYKQSSTSKF